MEEIDHCAEELNAAKSRYQRTSLDEWSELVERCITEVAEVSAAWVDAACDAKGISTGHPLRAEEVNAGPMATLRYLRLLHDSLRDISRSGKPRLPGPVRQIPGGQLRVRIVPVKRRFDTLFFPATTTDAWMQRDVTAESLAAQAVPAQYRGQAETPDISLVLGAGNVSSIAVTDTCAKILQEGKLVLLKMNPVNAYLGPVFEQALAPFIEAGFLRIIYGGADVGQYAVNHELVDEVHVTGSIDTYNAIVWGPPGPERERRMRENAPLLAKPLTSELGNVSPWIVVPGKYSERQLQFQAENIAASIINNASFNCLATKVIVTWQDWPDRDRFLDKLQTILNQIPPRKAYYPGAEERFRRFTGQEPTDVPEGTLPWTLVRNVDPELSPHFFEQESFVCVCAETGLAAASPEEFLTVATDFVNDRLWGTLCAAITVPRQFRKSQLGKKIFAECLSKLRYGAIGVNQWPGLVYALMAPPWGGSPHATPTDPQSGIGWVHNTFLVEGIEKTVTEGPLTQFPKPIWFPSYKNPEPVAWRLLEYYAEPSLWNLQRVLWSAVRNGIG